ncbi:MAG: hypothetical protein JWN10_588 [Solirubrobacterales bacterium]|nr:hypothetical protein [Solirubrobacterales bacterium]
MARTAFWRLLLAVTGGWHPQRSTASRPAGKNGATNVVVRFVEGNVPNASVGEQTVNCNAGERATGGGDQLWNGSDAGTSVIASSPVPNGQGETPTGWHVVWENKSGGTQTIHTYAICASP